MVELDQEVVRTARRFFPDLTRGLRFDFLFPRPCAVPPPPHWH